MSKKNKTESVSKEDMEKMAQQSSLGIAHHLLGDYISDEEMACFIIGQLSSMAISMTVVVECMKSIGADKDMVEFFDKVSEAMPHACVSLRESVLDRDGE